MVAANRRSPLTLSLAAVAMFIATLFFWLSAFSVPFIKGIHYIHTRENDVKFGNFGWCAGPPDTGYPGTVCYQHVGYDWSPWFPGNKHTTGALMLVALTAAFGTLAFFSLMHSVMDLRSGMCSFFLTNLTTFLATLSFLLVVIIFGTAHHRFKRDNLDPHYGAAFVLVIIGWLILLVTPPLVTIGWFRERRYRNRPEGYRA
ncbi:hypothetical protein L202_00161 [Cryptococcus amylolentus CBS 6039]|uniref:Pali-domain-containing protein n=2 Tax=Cryptococcus amylolentus TaxID=104669 RepID=A0A1E3I6H9_9TREE|nr:hypothetical protein L202_00161 [Cryptococcus amylolentus CBS 6039]ODN84157.1 hypothetical protein L202_00161 [Cryptococcus amylolentus CBS 6039]ODO11982.1 hypothetical protein I350_00766 [Cryptococcus amylolentus CBS 6273]